MWKDLRKMKIELQPGEDICPHCNGSGEEPGDFVGGFKITCHKCWGDRKLDWIEMAMGKQPVFGSTSSSSSSISESSKTTPRKENKNDAKWLHSRRIRNSGDYFRQLHVRQKGALERQFLQARSW